jgi:uncharacterized RDD family membrane protein YckC
METLELDLIETPENVELQRRLAGIGTRFIAGLIDTLWLALIYLALLLLALIAGLGAVGWSAEGLVRGAGLWILAGLILAAFAVYWGYFVAFELRTNGQSPGKKVMRIRVVKLEGGAITFTDVAIRNLLRSVDVLPAAYIAAGLCMFATRRCQRLGDLAAGTVVVVEGGADYAATPRRRRAPRGDPWAPPPGARAPEGSELTPREHRLLMNYWSRRNDLTIEARQRVLPKLLLPALRRLGREPPGTNVAVLEGCLHHLLFPTAAPPAPPPQAPPPAATDETGADAP